MRRNQKGFTLMELMVVIVIVAILAAVAVPLYINYVKDAQRTEAKGAIGAVITAEQVYFQVSGTYLDYTNANFKLPPAPPAPHLNCDLSDAQKNWTFDVINSSPTGFTVRAENSDKTLQQEMIYSRTTAAQWNDTFSGP
ncbi:MAG: prepilin-type N-terminal cleavage/methylation domain-containing protein [Candidatus Eisenbacteria bacterium]|nr:prepilin-type N-terminal cleavage/methylation domain-containing protein [Candidatus Eisenbacteria bacterium]